MRFGSIVRMNILTNLMSAQDHTEELKEHGLKLLEGLGKQYINALISKGACVCMCNGRILLQE